MCTIFERRRRKNIKPLTKDEELVRSDRGKLKIVISHPFVRVHYRAIN